MIDFDFCDEPFTDEPQYDEGSFDICAQHEDVNAQTSCEDIDDVGNSISFKGHIDELYDPDINRAHENLVRHTEDLLHADNADDAQLALDQVKQDTRSVNYWEQCKADALIESRKHEAFIEGINAQLDIIEKYRQ